MSPQGTMSLVVLPVLFIALLRNENAVSMSIEERKPSSVINHDKVKVSHKLQVQVADSLDRTLQYILENYKNINLDGLFGVVFAQAHLSNILQSNLDPDQRLLIQQLKTKADLIFVLIKPLLYNGNYKQTIFVEEILDPSLWTRRPISFRLGQLPPFHPHHHTPIDSSSYDGYLAYLSTSNMSETQSDQCLLELIQSGSRKYYHKCSLSEECQTSMVDDPKYDPTYGITHRLLYLQIGHGRKCNMDSDWYRSKTMAYCSYIFWEAQKNMNFGFLDELDDILLEQMTLCGYEGYSEFLQSEFIDHVLDIQNEHGCFSIPVSTTVNKNDNDNQQNGHRLRKRRSANLIRYGCNDHTTGLGASTLALILRYLSDK